MSSHFEGEDVDITKAKVRKFAVQMTQLTLPQGTHHGSSCVQLVVAWTSKSYLHFLDHQFHSSSPSSSSFFLLKMP
jgi:hypothetical protein